MASYYEVYRLFSRILLLSIGVQQYLPLVKGDPSLINDVCNKIGSNSIYCLACFNSMPRSNQEDVRGLGGTSIICAYSSALLLRQSLVDYSSNSTGDFQVATKNCIPNLDLASRDLVRALQGWRRHGYADAIDQINTALNDFWGCAEKLKFKSFPFELLNELVALRSRINIASSVISRISS